MIINFSKYYIICNKIEIGNYKLLIKKLYHLIC